MKRVLLEGSLAYDQILRYNGLFQENLNLNFVSSSFFCNDLNFAYGGTAGNIAYGMYKLGGITVDIFSALGELDSQSYLDRIKMWGFSLDNIHVVEKSRSATACICTDIKEQQLTFFYPGPAKIEALRLNAKTYDFACISANSVNLMEFAVEFCIENNVPFIFDPGQQVVEIFKFKDVNKAFKFAEFLIVNRSEFEYLVSKVKDLITLSKNIIVTNGESDIEIFSNNGEENYLYKVTKEIAIDPTGAGDAFRSAFIKCIIDGMPVNDAVDFAAKFSVKCIMNYGPQDY